MIHHNPQWLYYHYSMKVVALLCLVLLAMAQKYPQGGMISNILRNNEEYLLKVWITRNEETIISKDYELRYSINQEEIIENITLNVEDLSSNITFYSSLFKLYPEMLELAHQSKNLTRYQKVRKLMDDSSAVGSYDPMDEIVPSKTEGSVDNDTQYAMHIAKDFNLMVIHTDVVFPRNSHIPPNMNLKRIGESSYTCGIDVSQMHIPFRSYNKIVENEYNVTLHIFPYDVMKYAAFYSLGHPDKFWGQYGSAMGELMSLTFDENSIDELKEILFTNHIYLVASFFLLSMAQTILRFFTIKQEYQFWKNIENNKGVSLKTLFYQLVFSVILTLYVYEYNSSKMIIGFSLLDIAVTAWKINRTFKIKLSSSFPFITFQTTELYKKREKIDSQAVWYMNYLLIPLMILYLGYSLYSKDFIIKNYYIFFLQTSVAFIAIFGFIMMTPQLYINYKLKSVEHLNWKGLIYRFINTLLDDLFAFMVTMPMMRRLMYFRDDVIFICYIYQRWIYRVDYSRRAPESEDHEGTLKQE